jgi:predicted RND superfamily exporter protein
LAEIGEYAETWRWKGEDRLVTTTLSLADIVMEAHAAYQGSESARTIPASRAGVVALLDQIPVSDRESVTSADYSVAHVTMRMVTLGSNAWSALRVELEAEIAARPALDALDWTFTGSSTLGQDAMRFMTRDLLTSLGLAVVIIMILMSFLFRSVRVGVLSMVPNAFPMLVTAGVVGGMGIDIRVSTAVVFSISLGIAVDDTIHVLVRFREELGRRAGDYEAALRRAVDGAGRPVVFTTLMLCAGFATLSMSEFNAVRELGTLGAVTLVSALVGDLILLPLVLLSWRPRVR